MGRAHGPSLIAGTMFALVVFGFGLGLTLPWTSPRVELLPPVGEVISTRALERRFGIQLTHISVTHSGGLVELGFVVVDAFKARQLIDATPRLIADDTGWSLQAPELGPWRNIRLQQDAACFVLFPNARSTVKPGARVSLAFGGVRVEPVIVK
ncbi:MAG: hypothetical protein Q8K32_25795 [Archangium sp.]|nr:hypothetical protein [Archangium sp.]